MEDGDASVRLALIDTGLAIGQGELLQEIGQRVVVRRDLGGAGIEPTYPHATYVAGTAAAAKGNSIGVAGMAPNVSLVSYKVQPATFEVIDEWWEALLLAAAVDDADVINMSISLTGYDVIEQLAIDAAHSAGIVLVAAAGNLGVDMDAPGMFYAPAEYDHVISVAGSGQDDGRGIFPLGGSSNFGSAVDISAPAVDILTATLNSGLYAADSGTSYAAPMVSGVAALLSSRGFYGCEIDETTTGEDQFGNPISADQISWPGGGVGRLNAEKALEWWGGGPIVSDATWPNGAIIHTESDPIRWMINNGKKTPISGSFNERNDQCIPGDIFDSIPTDTDGDGWSDADEVIITTDPNDACGYTPGAPAQSETWPPDLVETNSINVSDALALKAVFGTTVPPTSIRFDLVPSGSINVTDELALKPYFGRSCTP